MSTMNGVDDADRLAAYAESLLERAKEAVARHNAARAEAKALLLRARIAIREAKAVTK